MRALTQIELERLAELTRVSREEVALFEVTSTQLSKCIVDAHEGVRESFRRTGYHDFDTQPQGPEHKVLHPVTVLHGEVEHTTTMSLYRPRTKLGDPRLWIQRLPTICPDIKPGDLMALAQDGERLVALNLSRTDMHSPRVRGAIQSHFGVVDDRLSPLASRLLESLERLATRPIPALKKGPTAIGHAIETALGIPANSSPLPDYFGIELKSARSKVATRVTLFAKVPDWSLSQYSSSRDFALAFGYPSRRPPAGRIDLNVSVTSTKPNSRGLQLQVDFENSRLLEVAWTQKGLQPALVWRLAVLQECLAKKHPETFWIHADETETPDGTAFQLRTVTHTAQPNLSNLALLLANGTIELDHLIKALPNGVATERGPLFKIWQADLPLLFDVRGTYELA